MAYFDLPEANGVTWRTYYKEAGDVVTITDLQLRSRIYNGPALYPGGEIAVNGEVVLKMDYFNPPTHAFDVPNIGEEFRSCRVVSGQALPVSSKRLTGKTAVISVNVELYRDGDTPLLPVSGSCEIPLSQGLVRVKAADGVKRCRAYVKKGGEIVPVGVVVKRNGSIKYCT